MNVTLFFYTTQKQVLQIVPILNESHEICILGFRPRLLHMCWPMHDGVQFSHILGFAKASPLTVDSWHERVAFVPVAGCQLHYDALEKNRMAKNCNIYPTSQYVVVTYFSSSRPCIQLLVYKKDTLSWEVVSCTIYPALKKRKYTKGSHL